MHREAALTWWKSLCECKQRNLAKKYYPNMPFIGVTKSTSMIHRMANKER